MSRRDAGKNAIWAYSIASLVHCPDCGVRGAQHLVGARSKCYYKLFAKVLDMTEFEVAVLEAARGE
ncbi:MAG: hypothetical protein L0Z53_06620 [Acidobacteriales bacterium]|nr:hypothetical protein [Terriglobales bacterium]